MPRLAALAFLNTRVSLHAARLQPADSLSTYIESADPVPPDYLQSVGLDYSPDDSEPSPGRLEQAFMTTLVSDAERIRHAMPPEAQALVRQWMQRFELTNLKSLIRCKLTDCPPDRASDYLFDLGSFGSLPLQRLLHSEDIDELMRILTEHDSVLANRIRDYTGDTKQLFLLEAAVDYHYYAGLLERCERLPPDERDSVKALVGRIIDQVNLVWILRYRLAYDLYPPHTYFMLVRTGQRLDRTRLARLARLEDLREIRNELPAEFGECLGERASLQEIENSIQQLTVEYARRLLRYEHFNLGRAVAYLYLRERQLLELHQVMKGKLLGFAPELIRESLFGEEA